MFTSYLLGGIQRNLIVNSVINVTRFNHPRKMSGETRPGVNLKTVIDKLLEFAPTSLAESWDNVGLLVEPVIQVPVSRILLTNDLTEDVLEEALLITANLIISYHPPIFAPLKKITNTSWKERIIARCIANNIAVFSPHTSWDVVKGGVNDWLAGAFQFKEVKPLIIQKFNVPNVSYIVTIESTDQPSLEKDLVNLESQFSNSEFKILSKENDNLKLSGCKFTIRCTEKVLNEVVQILKKMGDSVCYYYVTPDHTIEEAISGIGRIGTLENRLSIREVVDKLKKHIGTPFVQLALARKTTPEHVIETIAFVAGSGGSLLKNVQCDLKITGEASHHEVLDSVHNGSSVILTNHSNSERGFLEKFKQILTTALNNPNVQISVSSTDSDPLKVF